MTPAPAPLLETLRRVFGHDSLFPDQRAAIDALVGGRDVLLVLPTGGGKSLCYQLPAVARPGLAVVVSPLISLMRDQVQALRANGVAAASLDSSLGAGERRDVVAAVRERALKLLYLSPERLALPETARLLAEGGGPSFFAVDEAHCVSQWGHEFRPEYRQIAGIREAFPAPPLLACTATATEAVRIDIVSSLGLRDPAVIVGSVDRPNLVFRAVRRRPDVARQVEEVIARHPGDAGIVYCIRRADAEEVATALAARGHRAVPYHAGLDADTRRARQDDFAAERVDVVVATVAFGMGIDRSNVRYVVHAGLPRSIESYTQEAGRAGRDGLEAECVLLYGPQDVGAWRAILGEPRTAYDHAALARVQGMHRYCRTLLCRHRLLAAHFDEEYAPGSCGGACDVCLGEHEAVADSATLAKKLLSGVARVEQRFGARYVADVLKGARTERIIENGHDSLSTFALLGDQAVEDIADWLDQLVGLGLLVREGAYGVLKIAAPGVAFLKGAGEGEVRLAQPRARAAAGARSGSGGARRATVDAPLAPEEAALFEVLRADRRALAEARSVPAYVIFSDATLRALALERPASREALLRVRGIGEAKATDHGDRILALIRSHCEQHGLPLEPPRPVASPAPATAAPDDEPRPASRRLDATRRTAFDALRGGASIEDVARLTGRAPSTVEGYAVEVLAETRATSPEPFATAEEVERILEAADRVGRERLKPIFEALGGTVPYFKIKVALAVDANRRE